MALFVRDLQRGAVQVGTEREYISPAVLPEMINKRQRDLGFVRIINIRVAATMFMLLLQQAIALPQETGLSDSTLRGEVFSGPPAQRVIMIPCLKPALRPGSPGGDQAVFRVIVVMLFIQTASAVRLDDHSHQF